ncbi:MAG: sigma-70 family RNA polymerase sigma factor [Deltaproteobacteria bacterium]|nr:sigma-70 family RNA polymerase sigma factor [Nannocystaceae bacterium]
MVRRSATVVTVPDDGELYGAWTAGDRRAGAELIDRHLSTLGRFFANKASASIELEDLVAMTFERCARSLGGYRGERPFRSYLLGIAINVFRDELRRRRLAQPLDSYTLAALGPSPSHALAGREERRLLLAGLRALPLPYQVVLELGLFEELSQREIAEVLGIPPGTAASRLRRGRELLAAAIAELAPSVALSNATVNGLEAWAATVRAQLVRESSAV